MLFLKFYPNSQGVWVGDLHDNETRLLATTHPATIAAAIFAMDRPVLCVKTDPGSLKMQFPVDPSELSTMRFLMLDQSMADWMSLFFTFSWVDFSNPSPNDTHADVNFRTAVHHLPPELVKVRPSGPEPKIFTKQLKNRNKRIYYPWC